MKNAKSLYVMGSTIGLTKIGIAADPSARLRTIQGATGIRLSLVHSSDKTEKASTIEAAAHRLLAAKRKTGEWFDVTPEEAVEALAEAAKIVEERRTQKATGGYGQYGVHLGVRVNGETNEALEAMAAERGVSKSQVAREALEQFVREAIAARKRKRT